MSKSLRTKPRVRRKKVASSNAIAAVGYHKREKLLHVEFARGGVYEYSNVTPEIHRELMRSESPGAYCNEHIARKFPTVKLRDRKRKKG